MPRWVDANRVTFKYGLGDEYHRRPADAARARPGLDEPDAGAGRRRRRSSPARRGGGVPARPGEAGRADERQDLRRAVGEGHRQGRRRRAQVYLYHVVDNAWSMREYGSQAVVWQTAVNPVVALELLATGRVVGHGGARPGGVRRRALPGPAHRLRLALGAARGRLSCRRSGHDAPDHDGQERRRRHRPRGAARAAASAARRSAARRARSSARSARQRATTASTSTSPTGTAGPTGARSQSAIRRLSARAASRTARSSRRPATVPGSRSISRRSCSGVGSRGSADRPSRRR